MSLKDASLADNRGRLKEAGEEAALVVDLERCILRLVQTAEAQRRFRLNLPMTGRYIVGTVSKKGDRRFRIRRFLPDNFSKSQVSSYRDTGHFLRSGEFKTPDIYYLY